MKGSFVIGIAMGTAAGVAASFCALNSMRPDVTAKMMRNGKKVLHHYMRQMHAL